ncbi:MAG: hypothetical protein LWW95_08345 [Candidatus Desulfofervidus auxilii]|nr:hypothetical protein [Candidatus Desulfofervidus auxilii]
MFFLKNLESYDDSFGRVRAKVGAWTVRRVPRVARRPRRIWEKGRYVVTPKVKVVGKLRRVSPAPPKPVIVKAPPKEKIVREVIKEKVVEKVKPMPLIYHLRPLEPVRLEPVRELLPPPKYRRPAPPLVVKKPEEKKVEKPKPVKKEDLKKILPFLIGAGILALTAGGGEAEIT